MLPTFLTESIDFQVNGSTLSSIAFISSISLAFETPQKFRIIPCKHLLESVADALGLNSKIAADSS